MPELAGPTRSRSTPPTGSGGRRRRAAGPPPRPATRPPRRPAPRRTPAAPRGARGRRRRPGRLARRRPIGPTASHPTTLTAGGPPSPAGRGAGCSAPPSVPACRSSRRTSGGSKRARPSRSDSTSRLSANSAIRCVRVRSSARVWGPRSMRTVMRASWRTSRPKASSSVCA